MKTGLTLVTNTKLITRSLEDIVYEAVEHGVDTVILREKEMNAGDLFQLAIKLKKITDKFGKKLIINDRIDVAMAVKATGVHLGQKSLPLIEARRILGDKYVIGISTHSLEEAKEAEQKSADYIFAGHIYTTQSKPGLVPRGLKFLTNIIENIKIPVTAIGGINKNNLPELVECGINNVAVMSQILNSDSISLTVKELKSILKVE